MLTELKEDFAEVLDLLTTGRCKKVSGAQKIVEETLCKERVISRKALKERTGISGSELSRCLKALETEGKLLRCVDTTDGRRTVCMYQECATELSELDHRLLDLVHAHPELTYRELQECSGVDRTSYQASYHKLLSLGLVTHDEAQGRLYSVVTHQGVQKIRGAAC